MGANRYSCGNSFGAIRLPLWHTDSHNMAISPHFLAFLVTFLAVTTTDMLTLGISCTQTLVSHMGWWYGAIFALSGYLSGAGVVQNMAIVGSKSGLYGGLFPGWGSDLESVLWAISPYRHIMGLPRVLLTEGSFWPQNSHNYSLVLMLMLKWPQKRSICLILVGSMHK